MEILETKTDVGLVRDKNEDSVIALPHPKNKKIKLLVVADGMGGRDMGEVASNYVTESLVNWFISKSVATLNDTKKAEELLTKYIKRLNTNLIKEYGEDHLGTTLTVALINRRNTIILNTGDSRAYIYRKKKLIQVTEDDSDVWMYYKYGQVRKEDLRFFQNSNIISACIGICKELCIITPTILENDYDILLLVTDGVSDILTDKKLKKIIKTTDSDVLLRRIVNEAVYVNQKLKVPIRLKNKFLANYVIPYRGRDNASGAIFIKEV